MTKSVTGMAAIFICHLQPEPINTRLAIMSTFLLLPKWGGRRRGSSQQTLKLVCDCIILWSMTASQNLAFAATPPYTPSGSALDLVMLDPAFSLLGAAILNRSIVSPEVFALLQSPTKGR